MSSPATVPFIIGGQVADIPAANAAQARADGHTPAVDVRFKDGSRGTIPLSALGEASRDGVAVQDPMQVALHSMPQNQPAQMQEVTGGGNVGSTIGNFFKQLAKNTGSALGGQYVSTQEVPSAAQPAEFTLDDFKKSLSAQNLKQVPSRLADSIKSEASALAPGDTIMGRIGSGAANLYSLLATMKAGAGTPSEFENPIIKQQPVTQAEAITNAVNPPTKQMARFQNSVQAQLDNIKQAAQDSGTKIDSQKALLNVVRNAAAAKKQAYSALLEPNADVTRGTESIPNYQGATAGQNSATLSQLDQRLSAINAELYGGYERGAGDAQATRAALSGDTKTALIAESRGIRNILDQELAARNRMTPEDIAKARADYGSLYNLGSKLEQAMNSTRRVQNAQANQPSDLHVTPTGIALQQLQSTIRKYFGSPADRQIKNAFQR